MLLSDHPGISNQQSANWNESTELDDDDLYLVLCLYCSLEWRRLFLWIHVMNSKIKTKRICIKNRQCGYQTKWIWFTHEALVSTLHVIIMLMPVLWLAYASYLVCAIDNACGVFVFNSMTLVFSSIEVQYLFQRFHAT